MSRKERGSQETKTLSSQNIRNEFGSRDRHIFLDARLDLLVQHRQEQVPHPAARLRQGPQDVVPLAPDRTHDIVTANDRDGGYLWVVLGDHEQQLWRETRRDDGCVRRDERLAWWPHAFASRVVAGERRNLALPGTQVHRVSGRRHVFEICSWW